MVPPPPAAPAIPPWALISLQRAVGSIYCRSEEIPHVRKNTRRKLLFVTIFRKKGKGNRKLRTWRRAATIVEFDGLARDFDLNAGILADVNNGLRRILIGYEGVDLANMADTHRRGAGEFHRIRDKDHPAGIGDDRLGGAHLAIVEIEKGAVIIDRRHADHRIVDLELANEVDRGFTDNAPVRAP